MSLTNTTTEGGAPMILTATNQNSVTVQNLMTDLLMTIDVGGAICVVFAPND